MFINDQYEILIRARHESDRALPCNVRPSRLWLYVQRSMWSLRRDERDCGAASARARAEHELYSCDEDREATAGLMLFSL